LKKKNQELEKFKFVLDYKIKELKKQIEPRENDIKAMKDQIKEVCVCVCVCAVHLLSFAHCFVNRTVFCNSYVCPVIIIVA